MTPPDKPESEEELEARLRKLLGDEGEDSDESELDRRARELLEHPLAEHQVPHTELEKIESEFKGRIDGLDARLSEAQIHRKQDEANEKKRQSALIGKDDAQGLGIGLSIAYALLGIPLVFGAIGVVVDKSLGTAYAGMITLTGVVLAMAYVFFVISRQNK